MAELALNSQQSRAVESEFTSNPRVGWGGKWKDRNRCHRIERLLRQSEEDSFQILAVSFTYKAAENCATDSKVA